ncbi:MAG: hypothetical protein V3W34_07230 [Phycisphaerae bacterium]
MVNEVGGVMPAMMNRAVTADMAEATHMTYAGVANADMATADVTTADVTGTDVTGADVPPAGMAHSNMAAADVPAANMAAANMTANVATADVTAADMATSGMATTYMTAPTVTTTMPPTVTAAVLGQGWRTAQANNHNGHHREQSQLWDDSRAHVRPPIIGPGRGRSTAVAGVSRMLGTVQRPIFPSCVGNDSCSSNGAQVGQPRRVGLIDPHPRHDRR